MELDNNIKLQFQNEVTNSSMSDISFDLTTDSLELPESYEEWLKKVLNNDFEIEFDIDNDIDEVIMNNSTANQFSN